MIGFYENSHLSLSNGTYKFYDISSNCAIKLLMDENGLALSDIVFERTTQNGEMRNYVTKHQLDYVHL